jgi:uncharacterized protein YjdB
MSGDREIRLGVGEPRPKHIPQHFGGPTVAFQLRDSEQVTLTAEALDSEGNPANVTVAWSSSDESIVAVTDNGDGSALAVASPGAGGLGSVTVTVDVTDVSDGDVHTGTFDIEVVAGDAVTVNVAAGAPEAKP